MFPPLAAISQSSLRCLGQRVRVNMEIPVQCSRRFFMSLKELNKADVLGPVARNGKIVRGNSNGNALAVRCSGVVLKFTVGETVHDDSFLVKIPEKKEPYAVHIGNNTEKKAIHCTNIDNSFQTPRAHMTAQNLNRILMNGKAKSLSEMNVITKSMQVRTFKTERQSLTKPGSRLTIDVFSKQNKDNDPLQKGLLREEHKIRGKWKSFFRLRREYP